ncbi:hypothetical protein EVAR_45644_1 [Eumeta japonica]|uniref:Uncharacterized protein n=1 Tax=Eumeta variegata TaxID=151549 RepID=A0A4C1Y740_EUMVA|nr:hypothetical protein EVAR_45644_1 [Eumeta japonica]
MPVSSLQPAMSQRGRFETPTTDPNYSFLVRVRGCLSRVSPIDLTNIIRSCQVALRAIRLPFGERPRAAGARRAHARNNSRVCAGGGGR